MAGIRASFARLAPASGRGKIDSLSIQPNGIKRYTPGAGRPAMAQAARSVFTKRQATVI